MAALRSLDDERDGDGADADGLTVRGRDLHAHYARNALALLLWLAHRGRGALKREVRRQEHADPHQILERAFGNWTPAGT